MDVTEKVFALTTRIREFTPDGSNEPIEYYQLVLSVDYDGEPEELAVKINKQQYQLLKAADKKPASFLDDKKQ